MKQYGNWISNIFSPLELLMFIILFIGAIALIVTAYLVTRKQKIK